MWLLNPYRFGTAGLALGQPLDGGFFAGYISHTANGNPTHALIVAPRATGASGTGYPLATNLAYKTSNTPTANTYSDFDGAANTAGVVAAGIASHPATQFCVGLSIGGYTDWYLPARFELDIAYFNLKPSTGANNTSWGRNIYAVPQRNANWSAGNPTQTSVSAFRAGGAQAFLADLHWSSSNLPPGGGNVTDFDFFNGNQQQRDKGNLAIRTRAFRRIAL